MIEPLYVIEAFGKVAAMAKVSASTPKTPRYDYITPNGTWCEELPENKEVKDDGLLVVWPPDEPPVVSRD